MASHPQPPAAGLTPSAVKLVRGVVRGSQPGRRLQLLGATVVGTDPDVVVTCPPGMPAHPVPLRDLAVGFVSQSDSRRAMHGWAAVVRSAHFILFTGGDPVENDVMLEALWSASLGQPASDEALVVAKLLVAFDLGRPA